MKLISILLICLVHDAYTASSSLSGIKKIKDDIITAIEENKIKEAKKLLNQIEVNDSLSRFGGTALHYATAHGRQDLVLWLLEEKKANPNIQDNNGKTPLHLTAVKGNLNIAKGLLDHNADIDPTTPKGETPLSLAVANSHPSMVEYLLTPHVSKKTPNVNILYGSEKYTLLHLALLSYDLQRSKEEIKSLLDKKIMIIQRLLNTQINIHAQDRDGDSAIMTIPQIVEYFYKDNHLFEHELNAILNLFLKHPKIDLIQNAPAILTTLKERIALINQSSDKEKSIVSMLQKIQKSLLSRLGVNYQEKEKEHRRFITEQEVAELTTLSNEMNKNIDTIITSKKKEEDKARKQLIFLETIDRSTIKKLFLESNKEYTARSEMYIDQETEFQKLLLESTNSYQALSASESLLQEKTECLQRLLNEESAEVLEIMNSKTTEEHTISQKNLFQKYLHLLKKVKHTEQQKKDALTLKTFNKTIAPLSLCSCLNENMAMLGEPIACDYCQHKDQSNTNNTRRQCSSVYRPNLDQIDSAVISYKKQRL